MRRTAMTAALCFAAACGTDPAAPPGDSPTKMAPASGGLSGLTNCVGKDAVLGEAKMSPVYDCGEVVLVTGETDSLRTAIATAVQRWNGVLGQNNLPVFVTSGPADTTLPVRWISGTGPYICGNGQKGTKEIRLWRSQSSTSCGGATSTNPITNTRSNLANLVSHELSHAFGFGHLSERGTVPAVDHCNASLPDQGLNSGFCQAEIIKIQYHYGMRSDIVLSKPILIEMSVVGPTSVVEGEQVTMAVQTLTFDGDAGPSNPSGVRFLWSSAHPGTATTSSTTGPSNVITGIAEGTTQIRVELNDTRYQTKNPGDQTVKPFTVVGGPPPPPIGLNVTNITYNSVTVRWTNATNDVSTVIEIRLRNASQWTPTAATAVGATSRNIGGLSAETDYEIHAKHVRNNQSSVFTSPVVSFTTDPLPPPTITIFRPTRCTQQSSGGKLYNYFTMSWNASPAQVEGSYEIGWAIGGSLTPKLLLTVPGTQTTGQVGGYLSSSQTTNLWFWIRYVRTGIPATPWVPLNPNPLAVNNCAV